MKKIIAVIFFSTMVSCGPAIYKTNGEAIYMTGKNLDGNKLLDRKNSVIPFVKSCKTCHGKNGDAMRKVSLRFADLSASKQNYVPYTDSLFYRFLDHDLKSDGTKANIGVIWKMNDKDKSDLLNYLKEL